MKLCLIRSPARTRRASEHRETIEALELEIVADRADRERRASRLVKALEMFFVLGVLVYLKNRYWHC